MLEKQQQFDDIISIQDLFTVYFRLVEAIKQNDGIVPEDQREWLDYAQKRAIRFLVPNITEQHTISWRCLFCGTFQDYTFSRHGENNPNPMIQEGEEHGYTHCSYCSTPFIATWSKSLWGSVSLRPGITEDYFKLITQREKMEG